MQSDPVPVPGDHLVPVVGHEGVVERVTRAILTRRGGHAYLLAGPPGVGRAAVARRAAQVAMCTAPGLDAPCGHCRHCRLVAGGGHPDLHAPEPPLRIETVRELLRLVALSPTESAVRVVILTDMDMASTAAGNALLKTLEEPPSHCRLILTAGDLSGLLPTLRSRCQTFLLRPLPLATVEAALVAMGVDADRAALAARLSGGRFRWAADLAGTEGAWSERREWLGALTRLLSSDTHQRLALAAELAKDADSLARGLVLWRGWARDLVLTGYGVGEAVAAVDASAELERLAARTSPHQRVAWLSHVVQALDRLAANANRQMTLETLALAAPR